MRAGMRAHPYKNYSMIDPRDLLLEVEFLDERIVRARILAFEVLEVRTPIGNHAEQAAARMRVVWVLLEVCSKLIDLLRKQTNLHLGRAGICCVARCFLDHILLFSCGHHGCMLAHIDRWCKRTQNYCMPAHSELESLKRAFLEYLEIERGRSLKTIENYNHYLSRFLSQSQAREPRNITEQSVRDFRLWLNRQRSCNNPARSETLKKKTQNYHLIALRAFLKYLRKRHISSLEPETIELAKVGDRSLELVTHDELLRLLAAPTGAHAVAARDRALLHLLFSTGLRVSEVCALNADIDLTRNELSVRGKGDKVRVVFLSDAARSAVRAWVLARKDMGEALFVTLGTTRNTEHTRLTPRSVQRLVKHYAAIAGITRTITPHTIRHLFATDLLANGADLRSVQALLGHASITTTQIYTHVTDAHLREVHRRFHDTHHDVV